MAYSDSDMLSRQSQTKRLHICVLSRAVVQHQIAGGMELHAEMLRQGLTKRGHRVTTITTPHPASVPYQSDAWGEIFFAGTDAPGAYTRNWWRASLDALRQIHAHNPIDVVAGHGKAVYGYLGTRHSLPESERKPTVVITHNSIIHDFRGQFGQFRHRPHKVVRWLPHGVGFFLDDRRRLPLADSIIAPTIDHAQTLQRWFALNPNRIAVIPNGVDTAALIAAAPLRGLVRQRLGIGNTVGVVLVLARLTQDKGQHYLLQALVRPEMRAYRRSVRVLLAGDGPDRYPLIAQVHSLELQDVVVFLGQVSHDEVPGLLAAADIVVLPSVAEGMPISLLEAMSCGRPVIASDIPAIASFIKDGTTGRIVPVAQPASLARVITELLADRTFATELGRRAQVYAVEHFDERTVVAEYERVFLYTVNAGAHS